MEANGSDSVRVLLATKAKPNRYVGSLLDREYFMSFLKVSYILLIVLDSTRLYQNNRLLYCYS